jgi:CheY-like chemotaxis protein
MALLLHELSTNAAKYGSLSQKGGLLTLRWTYSDVDGCIVNWSESGGPPVKPPSRQGFGTVLIDRSISYDLGGESEVIYNPAGLRATFRIPARHASLDTRMQPASAAPAKAAQQRESGFENLHVLVVEDEMLIAINLEQILMDSGVSEITTASSSEDALQKIRYVKPDVAILDVNLGHETSVAVAEELKRRGIPFMLTTGYGDRSGLVEQFSEVTILNKPYEAAAIISSLSAITNSEPA